MMLLNPTALLIRSSSFLAAFSFVLLAYPLDALGVAGEDAPSALPLDKRQFQVYSGPHQFDEPGDLSQGGYAGRGARVTKTKYRAVSSEITGATVEIAEHDDAYPHVLHDLLGYIRVVAGYATPPNVQHWPKRKEQETPPEERFKFMDWTGSPSVKGRTILYAWPDKSTSFVTAWYSDAGGKRITVLIRCNGLPGWPVDVIDEYLAKYPSALVADRSLIERWDAVNLAKWANVLRNRDDDRAFIETAATQLMGYEDQQAFGIIEAMRKKSDPAAFDGALDQVVANIESFVREHPEYQVQERPGAGKDDH